MPCDVNDERLAAFEGGDLTAEQAGAMRAHLAECERCRQSVERLRQADEALRQMVGRPAPDAITRRVREALRLDSGGEEILTLEEVAALLRLSLDDLGEIVEELPAFELAGQLRVRRSKLMEWIEQRERAYLRRAVQCRTARIVKSDFGRDSVFVLTGT